MRRMVCRFIFPPPIAVGVIDETVFVPEGVVESWR